MAEEPDEITVIIETFRYDDKVRVSVAELGVALTVANRIVNRLAVDTRDYRRLDTTRYEPDWISLEVREIRQGSIILQAHEVLQDPYVQGVATGVLANILTPSIKHIVASSASGLRRLGLVAAGKTIHLTILLGRRTIRIVTAYREDGRVSTHVDIDPPDDIQ